MKLTSTNVPVCVEATSAAKMVQRASILLDRIGALALPVGLAYTARRGQTDATVVLMIKFVAMAFALASRAKAGDSHAFANR